MASVRGHLQQEQLQHGVANGTSAGQSLQAGEHLAVASAGNVGHKYSVINVYGNGKAILGNVNGGLDPTFLGHASETDRNLLILRSLYYNGMRARGIQISAKAGSPRSVDWVWSTDFARWLQTREKFYWITGQPGSGKSSLMKHVSESDKTLDFLQRSGDKWNILHFYFDFRAEDKTANRIDGMLRTFLHQFVKQVPSVAESVDPETIVSIGILTLHELLGLLTDLLDSSEAKICAFIDGLDEFRGSSSALLDVIHILGDRASTNMKICLASRPEPIFLQQLGKYPNLAVQDFNDESIRYYTEMVWHSQRIDASAKVPVVLSNAIRRKARGNFLWARLAMDLAVQGLLAGNTIDDLLEQVEQMPEGVQEMYKLTLQRLPVMLRMEAMLLLHLIVSAGGTLELRRLYTGLATAVGATGLDGLLLPIEHDADNCSRIVSILGSFVDVSNYWMQSKTTGTGISFAELPRFRIRCGGGAIESSYIAEDNTVIKLNHETLQAYLSQDSWLRKSLPATFVGRYPDNFWLKAYANELEACVVTDQASVLRYGTAVSTYILDVKAQIWYYPYTGPTTAEADLITLLRHWPSWTPLLPYAIDNFFEEVKADCQREHRLHESYERAIKSIAMIMHCALCHCQRLHITSAFWVGCLSGFNLHWKTGFVDLHCLETWSIYAAANHAIPEAVNWHLEHGQALAEYGSPRIQLLLTEILYKWCEKPSDTSHGYRKLLTLLVARGARFDSKHLCNIICRDVECSVNDLAVICDLMVSNKSPNINQGHSHWCGTPGMITQRSHYYSRWANSCCRGDSVGRKQIAALLKVILGFAPTTQYSDGGTPLHHLLRSGLELSSLNTNRMLKFIEALKAGVDYKAMDNHQTALELARHVETTVREGQPSLSRTHQELLMIADLLEYVAAHNGVLPSNIKYYESFNCWNKTVKSENGLSRVVPATGVDQVVLHDKTIWPMI